MANRPVIDSHKSSLGGIDANVMAVIAYVGTVIISLIPGIRYISWAAPLVLYFLEKESKFVKFHAMQSFVLHAIGAILGFIVNVIVGGIVRAAFYSSYSLYSAFGLTGVIGAISWIISIVIFVFAVMAVVNAYKYVEYRIPLIAGIADKVAGLLGKK